MKNNLKYIIIAAVFLAAGCLTAFFTMGNTASPAQTQTATQDTGSGIAAQSVEEYPAQTVEYNVTLLPEVTSNVWYGNPEQVYKILVSNKTRAVKGGYKDANMYDYVNNALTELGSFSRYFKNENNLTMEINGTRYGAYVEDGESPIGGGKGYKDIFTTGDYIVKNITELKDAISKAKSGEVIYIEGNVSIDITTIISGGGYLDVKEGVTLASNRGAMNPDGTVSTGARIYSASMANKAIYAQKGSRISGITLEGGDPNQHLAHHARAFSGAGAPGHSYYYKLSTLQTDGIYVVGSDAVIDNCEIGGFGHAAVFLAVGVKDAAVKYCYIHHNQANGLGYGICHNNDATSIVEYNLFNYNRHSIAATGAPKTGYIARFNIEMGSSLSHCFDIHGGSDRKDGTNIAGTYCEIYNNTFLADTNPYWLRGIPEEYQYFYHNVCINEYNQYTTNKLVGTRVKIYDNVFGIKNKTVKA